MDRRFSQIKDSDIARFWAKVKKGKPNECWEWQAACFKNRRGEESYGNFTIYKFTERSNYTGAHYFSYWLHNKRDPHPYLILHTCDNPKCVNPSHLKLATIQTNARDAARKFKMNQGEGVRTAKLTRKQVVLILNRVKGGESIASIARELSMAWSSIQKIVIGQSWKHVTSKH